MCQIKMAPLHPRFQSLLSPLSKIKVIQIIFFKKKNPSRWREDFATCTFVIYKYLHWCALLKRNSKLSSRAVQYHEQYSLQCHVISFCRGGRSRLVLTVSTSHSIPVLIPSLEKDTPKLSGEKAWFTSYFFHRRPSSMWVVMYHLRFWEELL